MVNIVKCADKTVSVWPVEQYTVKFKPILGSSVKAVEVGSSLNVQVCKET